MGSDGASDGVQMGSKDDDGRDYCLKTRRGRASDAQAAAEEIGGINSAAEMENV